MEYLANLGPLLTGSKLLAQGGCSPSASQAVLAMIGRIMSLGMLFFFFLSKVKRTDQLMLIKIIVAQEARVVAWVGISIPSSRAPAHGGTEKPRDWLKATYWLGVVLRLDAGGLTSEPKFLTAAYYSAPCFHVPYEQETRLFVRLLSVASTLFSRVCARPVPSSVMATATQWVGSVRCRGYCFAGE